MVVRKVSVGVVIGVGDGPVLGRINDALYGLRQHLSERGMVGVSGRFFECRSLGLGLGEHVAFGIVGVVGRGFEDKVGRINGAGVFVVLFSRDSCAAVPGIDGDVSESICDLVGHTIAIELHDPCLGI